MHLLPMLASHPVAAAHEGAGLAHCIELCRDCAQACIICADACLAEGAVAELRRCIRLNLDCADICDATARLLSRRAGGSAEDVLHGMMETCIAACGACGEECRRHAGHHEHCRICAEACRICGAACRDARGALSPVQ